MDETIDGDCSETIDKDGKEKDGTTFLGRHHYFHGVFLTNTARGSTLRMRTPSYYLTSTRRVSGIRLRPAIIIILLYYYYYCTHQYKGVKK